MGTHFISKIEARQILTNYKEGTIFTVVFYKRGNNMLRVMNCRKGVRKGVTGQGMSYDPKQYDLLPVYDVQIAKELKKQGNTKDKAFRMISLERVTKIVMKKTIYIVK